MNLNVKLTCTKIQHFLVYGKISLLYDVTKTNRREKIFHIFTTN